jgi:hypothetical protein
LLVPEFAQWNIHVAKGDIDHRTPCGISRIARDVASALSVPDDPESFRPSLSHCRSKPDSLESSEQPFGNEARPQIRGVREKMRLHSYGTSAFHVDLAIVDEERLFRPQAEAVEC